MSHADRSYNRGYVDGLHAHAVGKPPTGPTVFCSCPTCQASRREAGPSLGVESHAKTRGPFSIATSAAYLVPAAILLATDHLVAAFAFALLTLGTYLFHATPDDSGLDGAGMLAALAVLAALPYGLVPELVAVVIGLELRDHYRHALVGLMIAPALIVAVLFGAWAYALAAVVLLVVGLVIWRYPGDLAHATWHQLTAASMTVIVVALA